MDTQTLVIWIVMAVVGFGVLFKMAQSRGRNPVLWRVRRRDPRHRAHRHPHRGEVGRRVRSPNAGAASSCLLLPNRSAEPGDLNSLSKTSLAARVRSSRAFTTGSRTCSNIPSPSSTTNPGGSVLAFSPRPSPSMVVACVALLIALSGTGVAAVSALAPNSVGTAQIKANAVTTAKIKNSAVTGAKLAGNAVTSPRCSTSRSRRTTLPTVRSRPVLGVRLVRLGRPGYPATRCGRCSRRSTRTRRSSSRRPARAARRSSAAARR